MNASARPSDFRASVLPINHLSAPYPMQDDIAVYFKEYIKIIVCCSE